MAVGTDGSETHVDRRKEAKRIGNYSAEGVVEAGNTQARVFIRRNGSGYVEVRSLNNELHHLFEFGPEAERA